MNHLLMRRQFRLGILVLILMFTGMIYAQVGGPYTVDENTMLLLHFEDDLANASDSSADGVFHGDPSNFFFIANPVPNLGNCLRIDNDSQSDSAFVTVADTQYLDLTGDWTIEGWINIFTFGEGSDDWRWVPRLVIKTGDEVFWRPNYFVEMWGSTRFFSCGYHTASQDQWPQANSDANVMEVGQWYHMAFIRDTNRHLLLTVIHKYDSNSGTIDLVSFSTSDYLSFGAADPTPIVTNQPVTIGYAGGGGDSFLDGFVDEIRISNTVREFPIPPIISGTTVLNNQPTNVTEYEVGTNIFTLFGTTTIASAKLYYSLDDGQTWTDVDMTTVSGDSMSASIPQQPLGSVIRYYVEAIDNNGLAYIDPRDKGFAGAEDYSFGVYQPQTQTLALTFEEGSGVPIDTCGYANPVTPVGTPQHDANAAAGDYSVYLEGDSSYLEVDSPFLSASTFLVDFWMYPEVEMAERTYCRILNRPRDANTWANNNYQVRFNPDSRLYGGSDGHFVVTLDDSVEMDQWYHVMLEVQEAPMGDTVSFYAILRLADENDEVIEQKYVGFDTEVAQGFAPLRIGKAVAGDYPPFFKGNFDNVMIYNYPAAMLTVENIVTGIEDKPQVALKYELFQNYPNPFNPSTEIRFNLPKTDQVKLVVYDILGRKVKTLIDANMTSGRHVALWNGTDEFGYPVASGVYVYRLETKNFTQAKKMILMK